MPTIVDGNDVPLFAAPVAVFDFETTWEDGVGKRGESGSDFHLRVQHPVEVSVVHARLGVEGTAAVAFESLVRPPVSIREEAIAVHGIDDDAVWEAPTFEEIAYELLDALDGRVIVAYNLPFDWSVLRDSLNRYDLDGADDVPFYGLDPLVWAKVVWKYERGKKLTDVARRYGYPFRAHSSREDCMATATVAPMLLRDLVAHGYCEADDLRSVESAWNLTARTAMDWEDDFAEYHRRKRTGTVVHKVWRSLLGKGERK